MFPSSSLQYKLSSASVRFIAGDFIIVAGDAKEDDVVFEGDEISIPNIRLSPPASEMSFSNMQFPLSPSTRYLPTHAQTSFCKPAALTMAVGLAFNLDTRAAAHCINFGHNRCTTAAAVDATDDNGLAPLVEAHTMVAITIINITGHNAFGILRVQFSCLLLLVL